jgi:DNA-binding transcriptional LysR family regulator
MAAFESAGSTLMPPAIAAFRLQHPAVELSMSLSEPEDCVPLLRSGELDLAIVFESAVVDAHDGIDRLHLLEDPMYLALPRDHALATRRRVRLADLAGEAWVAGQPDCECNRLIARACALAGFQPRIAFETDDYTAVQGFVAAGVGVSLIAELGLTTVRDDIVVRDLGRETPARQIYAATLADGYRAPATQAMLEILRDVASRHESRRPRLELVS